VAAEDVQRAVGGVEADQRTFGRAPMMLEGLALDFVLGVAPGQAEVHQSDGFVGTTAGGSGDASDRECEVGVGLA